jgi:hypothetical protein
VVHGIEFVPSMRFHRSFGCHYFEVYQPLPCTFYAPHPKTSEMSLWYALNKLSDEVVFGHGVIQLRGVGKAKATAGEGPSEHCDDYCDDRGRTRDGPDARVDYSSLPPLQYS